MIFKQAPTNRQNRHYNIRRVCNYFISNFQVYVEPLAYNDLLFITKSMYPKIDGNVLEKMITFNSQVNIISACTD